MKKLTKDLISLLFARFSTIFGEKFSRQCKNQEFYEMWCQDWFEGLAGIEVDHIKHAIDYCRLNLDWSPSISEFRRICEKVSGMPSLNEAMMAAIRQDFSHPIIKTIYDKIGSWDMRHSTQEILTHKVAQAYEEALSEYRMDLYKQYILENDKKILPFKEISSIGCST